MMVNFLKRRKLERSTPKLAILSFEFVYPLYLCPKCRSIVGDFRHNIRLHISECEKCGQAIEQDVNKYKP